MPGGLLTCRAPRQKKPTLREGRPLALSGTGASMNRKTRIRRLSAPELSRCRKASSRKRGPRCAGVPYVRFQALTRIGHGALAGDCRQGRPNTVREIGRAIGRLRCFVDLRASPQFVEWHRCVDPARIIEVAVNQAVEEMANVKSAAPSGGVRIAHDVDRAAVGQQVIEFGRSASSLIRSR